MPPPWFEAGRTTESDGGRESRGKKLTPKQGQYLAFIHLYTRLHHRPPAETDMRKYFRVSPPSVHQMVLTLKRQDSSDDSRASLAASKCSLIRNACQSYFEPGFNLSGFQPVKITVQRY